MCFFVCTSFRINIFIFDIFYPTRNVISECCNVSVEIWGVLAAIAKLRGTGVDERSVTVCEESTHVKCLRLQDAIHRCKIADVVGVAVSSLVKFG